jgi:hypothetical protein
VQERVLSPRALYFGNEYIFCKCTSHCVSEMYPRDLEMMSPQWEAKTIRFVPDPSQDNHVHMLWETAVEANFKCALTRGNDKLVAIFGVARLLSALGGPEEYIAGIWLRYLLSEIQWECGEFRGTDWVSGVRPSRYRAPTWSWASLDGVITLLLYKMEEQSLITLINLNVYHLTDDPYGEVKGAYIRVAGRLRAAAFKRSQHSDILYPKVTLNSHQQSFHTSWENVNVSPDVMGSDVARMARLYFLPCSKIWS